MNVLEFLPSLLFTPGTKDDYFHKAYEVGAGGVILDLEDSVSSQEKNLAMKKILSYLTTPPKYSRPFAHIVRINVISTSHGIKDLQDLLDAKIFCDAISIPKVDSPEDLQKVIKVMNEKEIFFPLMVQIESQKSVSNLEEIVKSCEQIHALAFGGADYSLDLGTIPMNWDSFFYARARMVFAGSIQKAGIFDTPFFQINNTAELKKETEKIKDLGFTGKLAIHPSQIPIINRVFLPTNKETSQAKNIVEAFEKAGENACQYQGLMIDVPIYERAKKILHRAKMLSKFPLE